MRSTSAAAGGGLSSVWPASAARPEGSHSSSVAIACRSCSPLARAPLEPLLGGGALLARRAHRLERLAGGAVGLGEGVLALRARIRGLLSSRFRPIVLVGQRAAAAAEFDWRLGEAGALLLGERLALGKFSDAGVRAIAPFAPGPLLGGDRLSSRGARLRLARERLRRGARLGEPSPLARRRGARASEAVDQIVAGAESAKRGFRARLARGRLVARGRGAREAFLDRRETRQDLGALSVKFGERLARIVRSRTGCARPLPPFRFRRCRRPRCIDRLGGVDGEHRRGLAGGFGLALEVAETILLGEPARGRRRRFRRGDEAVPAPKIALPRDKALAGLEKPAQGAFLPPAERRRPEPDGGQARAARRRARRADPRPAADQGPRRPRRSATNARAPSH